MTKLVRFQAVNCGKFHSEIERLFKQEKVKSWNFFGSYMVLEIPDNEDVKLE